MSVTAISHRQLGEGSSVETITATSGEHLVLSLSREDCTSRIQALEAILERADLHSDFLSERIKSWAGRVLEDTFLHKDDSEEEISRIARAHIQFLQVILINPIDKSPLQEPVLDNLGWTWEKWLYEICNTLFEGQFMETAMQAKPHLFAKEMIEWMKAFILAEKFEERAVPEGALVEEEMKAVMQDPRLKEMVRDQCYKLAKKEFSEAKTLADFAQKAKAKAAAHEAQLQGLVDGLLEDCLGIIEDLKEKIEFLKKNHLEKERALEARIAEVKESSAAQAKIFEEQLAAMHKEHQEAIANLSEKVEEKEKVYQEHFARLNSRLDAQEKTISDSSDSLHRSQEEIMQLKRELKDLQEKIQQEADKVTGLQHQIQNHHCHRGGCIVM